jgi:predicted nuclease with TOPRIM domain
MERIVQDVDQLLKILQSFPNLVEQNERIKADLNHLQIENERLRTELTKTQIEVAEAQRHIAAVIWDKRNTIEVATNKHTLEQEKTDLQVTLNVSIHLFLLGFF